MATYKRVVIRTKDFPFQNGLPDVKVTLMPEFEGIYPTDSNGEVLVDFVKDIGVVAEKVGYDTAIYHGNRLNFTDDEAELSLTMLLDVGPSSPPPPSPPPPESTFKIHITLLSVFPPPYSGLVICIGAVSFLNLPNGFQVASSFRMTNATSGAVVGSGGVTAGNWANGTPVAFSCQGEMPAVGNYFFNVIMKVTNAQGLMIAGDVATKPFTITGGQNPYSWSWN